MFDTCISDRRDSFPYGNKLPPTNIPVSTYGPVPRWVTHRQTGPDWLVHNLNDIHNAFIDMSILLYFCWKRILRNYFASTIYFCCVTLHCQSICNFKKKIIAMIVYHNIMDLPLSPSFLLSLSFSLSLYPTFNLKDCLYLWDLIKIKYSFSIKLIFHS